MFLKLTSETGSSLTLSIDDQALRNEIFTQTKKMVCSAFQACGHNGIRTDGMTPEILSDKTAYRIETLVGALEQCLSLMDEIEGRDDSEWAETVKDARYALTGEMI